MDVLLSRYADAAFWMARYMERAENLARIIDVNETFARDQHGAPNWLSIVQINADEERFNARHSGADGPSVIYFYVLDTANPTSIVAMVAAARENARTLRPLISTEMWAQLNTFNGWLKGLAPADVALPRLARLCAAVKEGCQTHTGIVEGTFYRDQGWYFHQIGKYLERADQTTRLLDIKYHTLLPSPEDVGSPLDASQWNALLRSAAGYHAFRRVHPRGMHPRRVAEFLLFNDSFPRSVQLCMARAGELIAQLRSRYGLAGGSAALERLDEVQAVFAGRPIEQVIAAGLHEFLDWQQRQIIALTADLGRGFFGWAEAA